MNPFLDAIEFSDFFFSPCKTQFQNSQHPNQLIFGDTKNPIFSSEALNPFFWKVQILYSFIQR